MELGESLLDRKTNRINELNDIISARSADIKKLELMIRLLEAKRNNDRKYIEIGNACVENASKTGEDIIFMCQKKRGWTVPEVTYATGEQVQTLLPESKGQLDEAMEYLKDK